MARAEVDLDDPVKGRDDAGSNSADDLLAQLAGDEVERMLSEADAAAPEPLNVDRAVPDAPGGAAVIALARAAVPASASSAALATAAADASGASETGAVLEAT